MEFLYFLRFRFFRSLLHTVGVTGSNPVSPTTLFNNLCYPRLKQNVG